MLFTKFSLLIQIMCFNENLLKNIFYMREETRRGEFVLLRIIKYRYIRTDDFWSKQLINYSFKIIVQKVDFVATRSIAFLHYLLNLNKRFT